MKSIVSYCAVICASLMACSVASAAMMIRVTDYTGTPISISGTDQVTGIAGTFDDLQSGTLGKLLIAGTVGAFDVTATGASKPLLPSLGFTHDEMDLNSLTIATTGPGKVRIELWDGGFGDPGSPSFAISNVGGTFNAGITAKFDVYMSTDLVTPFSATGTHVSLGTFSPPPGSFDSGDIVTGLPALPSGFSMYIVAELEFSTGGSVSFDANNSVYGPGENPPFVPEPTSLAIWGVGLSILGLVCNRRGKRGAV
jgi:hypothetical protein